MNAFALSLLIDKINDKYFFKSKKIIIKESTEGRLSTYEYLLFLNKYILKYLMIQVNIQYLLG